MHVYLRIYLWTTPFFIGLTDKLTNASFHFGC